MPRQARGTLRKLFTKPAKRPDGGQCIHILLCSHTQEHQSSRARFNAPPIPIPNNMTMHRCSTEGIVDRSCICGLAKSDVKLTCNSLKSTVLMRPKASSGDVQTPSLFVSYTAVHISVDRYKLSKLDATLNSFLCVCGYVETKIVCLSASLSSKLNLLHELPQCR